MSSALPTSPDYQLAQSTESLGSVEGNSPLSALSLAKDVARIKDLIALSSAGADEGIGRQIFRRSIRVHVSQQQLLEELEVLRKKLRKAANLGSDGTNGFGGDESDDEETRGSAEQGREIQSLKKEIERVKKEREEWMQDAEWRIDQAVEAREELTRRVRTTTERLEGVVSEKAALMERVSEATTKHDGLQKQVQDIEAELVQARQSVQEAVGNYHDVQKAHQELQKTVEQLHEDIEALRVQKTREVNSLIDKYRHATEEVDVLKGHVADKEQQLSQAQLARQDLENSLRKQTEALNQLREQRSIEEQESQQKGAELASEHASHVADLQSQLSALHNEIESSRKSFDHELGTARSRARELEEAVQNAEHESHSVRAQLLDLSQKHAEELSRHKSGFQEELAAQELQHRNVTQKLHESTNRLEELDASRKEKLAELAGKLARVTKALQTAENEHTATEAAWQARQQDLESQILQSTNKVSELDRKVKQLEANATVNEESINDRNAKVKELEFALVQSQETNKKAELEAKAQADRLSEAYEQAQSRIKEIEKIHLETAQRLEDERKDEMTRVKAEIQADFDNRLESMAEETANLRDEHAASLVAAQENHRIQVEQIMGAHTLQTSHAQEQHAHRIAELQAHLEAQQSESAHEAARQVQSAREKHEATVADLHAQLSEARLSHEASLNAAEERYNKSKLDIQHVHLQELQELKSSLESESHNALEELRKSALEHTSEDLAALRRDHAHEMEQLKRQAADDLERLQASHALNLQKGEDMHSQKTQELKDGLENKQRQVAAVKEDLSRQVTELEASHLQETQSLRAMVAQLRIEAEQFDANHASTLTKLKNEHEGALRMAAERAAETQSQVLEKHSQELHELASGHEAQIDELKQEHAQALVQMRQSLGSKFQESLSQHQMELQDLEQRLRNQIQDKDIRHQALMDDAKQTAEDTRLETERTHVEDVERVKSDCAASISALQQSFEEKLKGLAKDYEVKTRLDEEKGEQRLNKLSAEHAQRLSQTCDRHQQILEESQQDHERSLLASQQLNEKKLLETQQGFDLKQSNHERDHAQQLSEVRDESRSQIDAANAAHASKMSKLEQELASSTSAAANQQRDSEIRLRALEDRLAFAASEQEKTVDDLQKRLAAALESKSRSDEAQLELAAELDKLRRDAPAATRTFDEQSKSIDQAALEARLAQMEDDRRAAAMSAMRLKSEREDMRGQVQVLADQVTSLTLELERVTQGQTAPTDRSSSNASVSKGYDGLGNRSNEQLNRRVDGFTLQQHTSAARPTTPETRASHGAYAQDSPSSRSFEKYLQQAETELSELGRVISANEALFAQKIREHVGDLQMAKNQMAQEYKDKFDALVKDRQQLESNATSQQIAELEAARDNLKANFGRTMMPARRLDNLQKADSRLIVEHNTKLAKKKSQIALDHAAEFQALSDEYDKRIAQLYGDKEQLSGDLSIEPAHFEELSSEMDAMSLRLEAERHSVASSPATKQTNDADSPLPRTPSRAPNGSRSSRRHSEQHIASARTQTQRSGEFARVGSEQSSPLRSPFRPISPPDGPIPRRTVAMPRTSDKWASPVDSKRNVAVDLSIEPDNFEGVVRKNKVQHQVRRDGQMPAGQGSPQSLRREPRSAHG